VWNDVCSHGNESVACLMAADDCFRLGAVAYFNQDYYHTVMWITEALNIWTTEQPKTIDKPTLLDYLAYSLYMVSHALRQHYVHRHF